MLTRRHMAASCGKIKSIGLAKILDALTEECPSQSARVKQGATMDCRSCPV
jgi:hypothetical protein